ncbi:MAG TPA: TolC family protein, partial [Pirellulales bacterium]|nr:TolC family protein [Pirellulales bacterium]
MRLASARLAEQSLAAQGPVPIQEEVIAAPPAKRSPVEADRLAPEGPGPPAEPDGQAPYMIDLLSVLRLADGNNLQVAIAREQIEQAWAGVDAARAIWLPSIRGGMNYDRHDGPIQNVNGSVIQVSRSSFFSGLGAGVVGAGLPIFPGIYSNFHTADAIFGPLA